MANNKQVRIGIGFDVDKSGLNIAQKELQNMLGSLNQINVTGKLSKGMDDYNKGLREAGQTASKLYDILEKSYSAQLGTVNVTKFKQELDKAGLSVKTLKQNLMKAGPEGAAAFARVGSALLNTNVQIKKTNTLLDEMAQSMANTVKWGITSSIFNNISNSVQDAFHYVKQLDSSLNDIRIVTDKSAESMAKFAVQANNAAKNLGASTRDYTDASLIYYQQGLAEADVQARAETTLKAANVTGQNTAEVSEQLTAVWNGYKVSASEAELYVDKLAAVAATTASDLEELSTGMSKVASAASIMGVDIDSLNAQLATIVSVTRQAPESVGTALKTIYARMGDIEAGVDTETTLGNYTAEMEAMGFNVLDANGKLRDMGDVIEEIGGKWNTMSREQQIALSQTMAGTRQYNNLLSLFDNWDMYTEALNTSADAAGTLQKQQDIYMESTAAHLQQLSTSVEDIFDTLIEPEEVNAIIDVFKNGTDVLGTFFDVFGGGITSMTAGAAVLSGVFSKQIGEGLGSLVKKKTEGQRNVDRVKMNEDLAREQIDLKGKEASSEDTAAVARYEKERAVAEQILAVQKGITNEQYQQRIQSQEKIGQLEEEKALIKEDFKRDTEVGKYYAAEWGEDFDKEIFGDAETQADFLERLNTDAQNLIKNYNDAQESQNNLSKELIELKNELIEKEKELQSVQLDESKKNKQNEIDKLKMDIEDKEKKVEESKKEADKAKEKADEAQKRYDDTKKAQNAYNEKDQEQKGYQAGLNIELEEDEKLASIANTFDIIGNSAEIATLAIGGFASIIDIINNEDLTFGEKLVQGLLLAATTIPMIINSFQTLKTALAEVNIFTTAHNALVKIGTSDNVKNAASEFAQAIAKKKTTEEINKQSAALKGENAEQSKNTLSNFGAAGKGLLSVLKSIPPQAYLVAAAVIAISAACVFAYKESIKYNEALKQANQIQQEAVTNLNDTKTAYDETVKSISDYRTGLSALKELTKGTQEWNEAVLNLNSNVLSLMEKYPELVKFITNNNGVLEIEEKGFDFIIDSETQKVKNAQQSVYLANANLANARNQKAIYDDFKLKETIDGRDYEYSGWGANVKNIIDLMNQGQSDLLSMSDTKLAETLGETVYNAKLYKENSEAIMELSSQLAANEQIMDANNQLLADSMLEEDSEYSRLSEDEQQIVSKLVAKDLNNIEQLSTLDTFERNKKLKEIDFLKGKNNIEDAIKVLEAMGKNADDYEIQKAGGGTFEYRKSGTDDEFTKVSYKDFIDQVYANEQSKEITDKFDIESLTQSFNTLDKEVGLTTSNIISKFIATGGELKNLSEIELKAIKTALENGDLSADIINNAFSEKQLKDLGYENGEVFIQSLENSLSTENIFKDIFDKTFSQAGKSGEEALNKVLADTDENKYSKLATALEQINWNSNHVLEDLNEILEQQGVNLDITTQAWKDYIAEMQRGAGLIGADILKSNQQEVAKIIDDLDINESISAEDFETIVAQSASAANYFVEQLDGTYKLVTSHDNLANHFFGDFEAQAQRNIELLIQIQELSRNIKNQQSWQEAINNAADTATGAREHGGGYNEKGHAIQSYRETEDGATIAEAAMAAQGISQNQLARSISTLDAYENKDYDTLSEEAKSKVDMARAVVDGVYEYIDNALNDPDSLNDDIQTNRETIAAAHTSSSSLDASFAETAINSETDIDTLENLEIQGDALRRLAAEYESCSDELEAYNEVLKTQSEDSEDARKAHVALNKAVKQAEWNKMAKNVSKAISEIKDLTKGTEEYEQKAQEIANSINEAFGTNVTKEFYEENQALMDEWANSSGEKAGELTLKIQQMAQIASMTETDIPFNVKVDDTELTAFEDKQAALRSIIESNPITINAKGEADMSNLIAALSDAGASADWVAKYLAQIGQTNVKISTDGFDFTDIDLSTEDGIKQFAKMWKKANGSGLKVTGTWPDVSPSMKSSGGGGGGGGSKAKAEEKEEEFDPDIDPFHEINEQIELLDANLDRLAKKQEKAFGRELINNLKEQSKILEQQNKNLKEKIRITEQEIAKNKKEMESLKIAGKEVSLKYNADGSIANYDEALAAAAARVNALIAKYNQVAEKEYQEDSQEAKNREQLKEDIEKAKEDYEELQKLMDEYDEYLISKEDLINQIQDNIDQIVENNVAIFTTAIKIKVEVRDIKISYNDFLKEWNSLTAKQPAKLSVDTSFENAKEARRNIVDLTTMVDKTQKELAIIQQGGVSSLFGQNEQLAYETLKEYTSQLQDAISDFQGYYQEIADTMIDAMDQVGEAMDEQISNMEFYADSLQHAINVNQQLFGEEGSATSNKGYYKDLVAQNNSTIQALRQNANYWKKEMDEMAGVNEEAYKVAKENYIAATQEMQSALENSLENIQAALENSITSIFDTFTNTLLSKNWGLDNMIQDWEMAVSESETYLTNIAKANQLKQLELKYQQAIDNSSSLSIQRELIALKQEELNMLKEQGRLTQYDIDRANKKLQLRLAEIALEEAQNNKSKLRLRRDSQGNYSYQYVADEDDIAKKQADVDNLKAEMSNDDWNYFKTNVSDALSDFSSFKSDYAEMLASGASQEELQEFLENYAQDMANNTDLFNDSIKYLLDSTSVATGQDLDKMTQAEKIAMLQEQFGEDIMTAEALSFLELLSNNTKTAEDATKYLNDNILSLAKEEIAWAEKQEKLASSYAGYGENFSGMETALEGINDQVAIFNENSKETIKNLKSQLNGVQDVFKRIADFLTDEKVLAGLEALKKAVGPDGAKDDGSLSAASNDEEAGKTGDTTGTKEMTENNTDAERIANIQGSENFTIDRSPTQTIVAVVDEELMKKLNIRADNDSKKKKASFDTGGYTGNWNSSEGRLAFLHQKELVLNAKDTENMLKMLDISRSMSSVFASVSDKVRGMMSQLEMNNYSSQMRGSWGNGAQELEQNVHIEATFPNVSQSHEIEDAFNNLINIAAQRAYKQQ